MTTHTLTGRQLNRALLARQLLLERASLSIPDAVEQVGGLQTQYAPSGYVALWTRLRSNRLGWARRTNGRSLTRPAAISDSARASSSYVPPT